MQKVPVINSFRVQKVLEDGVEVLAQSERAPQKIGALATTVERLDPIHTAQVLTYLKLTGLHLGLLMNFNATRLVDGYKRLVRDFPQ